MATGGGRLISIRTLREGECFPQNLGTGFESMPVMNSFVWVAEVDGKIVGILMTAPCHGLIFIVRMRVVEGSPSTVAHLLFRHCMKDAKAMGFRGYFSYISPQTETERSLLSICRRAGGMQVTQLQVPLVGSLESAVKF